MTTAAAPPNRSLALANWLFAIAAMVFAMVVVGGITRLTESGLSITQWQPLSGAIPPLSQEDWTGRSRLPATRISRDHGPAAWASPVQANYFWEWLHRLLGRLIGLAFRAAARLVRGGRPSARLGWKWSGCCCSARSGALGWYMSNRVAERTDVATCACPRLCSGLGDYGACCGRTRSAPVAPPE